MLGRRDALIGGLTVPSRCGGVVLRQPSATIVHHAKDILGSRIALVG